MQGVGVMVSVGKNESRNGGWGLVEGEDGNKKLTLSFSVSGWMPSDNNSLTFCISGNKDKGRE